MVPNIFCFFFFNDTATTEIYTLSLHDALPISGDRTAERVAVTAYASNGDALRFYARRGFRPRSITSGGDRKSTRLNSSHANISYAVFCLKKKKTQPLQNTTSTTTTIPHYIDK